MYFTKTVAELLQPKWSRKWSHTKMIARSKTSAKKMKTMIMIDHFSVQVLYDQTQNSYEIYNRVVS